MEARFPASYLCRQHNHHIILHMLVEIHACASQVLRMQAAIFPEIKVLSILFSQVLVSDPLITLRYGEVTVYVRQHEGKGEDTAENQHSSKSHHVDCKLRLLL